MKNLFFAATFFLVSGLTVSFNAQTAGPPSEKVSKKDASPEERAKMEANNMEKKLGLNAEQKAKWEAAAKQRVIANKPLREKLAGSTTPDERKNLRQEAKKNKDTFDAALGTFLTPAQKEKFEGIRKEKMKAKQNKRKAGKDNSKSEVENELIDE